MNRIPDMVRSPALNHVCSSELQLSQRKAGSVPPLKERCGRRWSSWWRKSQVAKPEQSSVSFRMLGTLVAVWRRPKASDMGSRFWMEVHLPKTNIDPDNGNLEGCFPLANQWFSGSMLVFGGVTGHAENC